MNSFSRGSVCVWRGGAWSHGVSLFNHKVFPLEGVLAVPPPYRREACVSVPRFNAKRKSPKNKAVKGIRVERGAGGVRRGGFW